MSLFVTKADGTRQLFDREKVVRTCLRMGASWEIAEEIAEEIDGKIFDGIETGEILKMIFKLLRRYKPTISHLRDLREALAMMKPKPDFENFVQIVLSEDGYEVTPNQIVRGKCVEHEVDAIARKNGVTCLVEVKHHFNFHTPTGLDESRIARAVLEDVTEGFELGLNNIQIDKAMIITNTKFSEHAKRYAECRGILQIGWSSPPYRGLQDIIEENKLHPMTCIKDLRTEAREKLASTGTILLKQLTESRLEELKRKTGMSKETLEQIIGKARAIHTSLEKIH